jgi:threonylcarbamoyladenosine tRNA methylthiotransferase MtaB
MKKYFLIFIFPSKADVIKFSVYEKKIHQGNLFCKNRDDQEKNYPLAGIGADVIVGFPGETPEDFEDTFSFLEEMPLSYLHVFSFSERPGTVAEKLSGKVPNAEKERRSKKLIELSDKKNLEFIKLNIGEVTSVLFEKTRSEGLLTGFTSNYLKTEYPWQAKLAGEIRKVKLKGILDNGRINVELIGR